MIRGVLQLILCKHELFCGFKPSVDYHNIPVFTGNVQLKMHHHNCRNTTTTFYINSNLSADVNDARALWLMYFRNFLIEFILQMLCIVLYSFNSFWPSWSMVYQWGLLIFNRGEFRRICSIYHSLQCFRKLDIWIYSYIFQGQWLSFILQLFMYNMSSFIPLGFDFIQFIMYFFCYAIRKYMFCLGVLLVNETCDIPC